MDVPQFRLAYNVNKTAAHDTSMESNVNFPHGIFDESTELLDHTSSNMHQ